MAIIHPLNITENPNNNVTFAPITENEQNIGYVIERDNGYSNELSESDFAVKQKNGEYGTRNGITYGHLVHIKIQTVIILFHIYRQAMR